MRALILSDIHGNLDALEAVIAAAPAHDVVWNLGDLVGYGAQPNEVIDRAQALGSMFVRGNHDRAVSGLISLAGFNSVAARSDTWTGEVLTAEHMEWLRSLPKGPVKIPIALPPAEIRAGAESEVSCVHGSIVDEDEYLLTVDDAVLSLKRASTRLNFFGHTHRQGGFATNGDEWFTLAPLYVSDNGAETWNLVLREGARYLINPGSVGQPRDGDWRSACAVCDFDRQVVEFCRVPYDVRAAQMRIRRAGLPDRLATRLREGR